MKIRAASLVLSSSHHMGKLTHRPRCSQHEPSICTHTLKQQQLQQQRLRRGVNITAAAETLLTEVECHECHYHQSLKTPSVEKNEREEEGEESSSFGSLSLALKALEWTAVCCVHEIEEWRRDNPWILSGYRKLNYSYATCFRTLFFVHNETGNIFSHLFGAALFVLLALHAYFYILLPNFYDRIIFGFFFFCAIGCLLSSGFFHLFSCHSHSVSISWNKCDYVGIMLMIVGSCFPSIYYSFHCTPQLQLLYLAVISLFGLACLPTLVMDRFTEPK